MDMENFTFVKRRKRGDCKNLLSYQILNTPKVECPSDTLIIATELLIHFLGIVHR